MALAEQLDTSASRAAAPAADTLEHDTQRLLDRVHALVLQGDTLAAFRLLGTPLSALWTEARGCGRGQEMQRWCAGHALHALVQQDPYTHRAATKPRGYAGDAVMMDFIYGGEAPAGTSPLGRRVFAATTRVSMGLSVLYGRLLGRCGAHRARPLRHLGRQFLVPSGGRASARYGRRQHQRGLVVAAVVGRELAQQPPCAAGAGAFRPQLARARRRLVGAAAVRGAGVGTAARRHGRSGVLSFSRRQRPGRLPARPMRARCPAATTASPAPAPPAPC